MNSNIALIILNYNSKEDTIKCVKNLQSFNAKYHLIVVDNCSTDNSYQDLLKEFKNQFNVDVLKTQKNDGYSAGNNYGIKFAIKNYNVSIVGILNPDVIILNENTISNLAQRLESNRQYAIIGGATHNADGKFNIRYAAWKIPTSFELLRGQSLITSSPNKESRFKEIEPGLLKVECVAGCFFLAKVSVLEEINFLDENVFLYNEENILGIKCKRAGYLEIVDINEAYIHNHVHKKNENIPFMKKINITKNTYNSRKYLCKKYYSKKLLPVLWGIERVNKIYLVLAYLKNSLIRSRGNKDVKDK